MSTQIVEFNQFEADLAEYKSRYVGVVYDFGDAGQEKQARSDRLAIGKKVAELDRVHKAVKAPLLEQVQVLDGERKRIKDGLLEVQDGIKGQIAKHEAELKAIEDALLAKVEAIKNLGAIDEHGATSGQVRERLAQAQAIVVDDSYGAYDVDAALSQVAVTDRLAHMLARVEQREAEQAEFARVKAELAAKEQAERDERIAREAREAAEKKAQEAQARELEALRAEKQARIDAEARAIQAKVDAQAAAEQAEIDKAVAVQQAKDDAAREVREFAEKERAEQTSKSQQFDCRYAIYKELGEWCKKHGVSGDARDELGEIVSRHIPYSEQRKSA